LAGNIFKNKDRMASSGTKVLSIGVALLIFTFISAFVFLTENLQILATQNMAQTFGEALVPLIATCVRVMYLGVMGWIGSLITIRGITILNSSPKVEVSGTQSQEVLQKTQPKPQRAQEKTKRETKTKVEPAEPEMVVIPMEEMQQQKKPV
jgi:tRNA A37 threonylcarbamoyladenosine modification protein TsaB